MSPDQTDAITAKPFPGSDSSFSDQPDKNSVLEGIELDRGGSDIGALRFLGERIVLTFSRSIETSQRGATAIRLCILGRNLRGERIGYRTASFSAFIYVSTALIWALVDDNLAPLTLVNALVIGAFIAPGLAPWLRLFPIAGDPTFKGWQRLVDLLINGIVHTLSSGMFVFILKVLVALLALPLLGELSWPNFFKGSIGLIIAGYFRRFATEMIGIRTLVPRHSLTPKLLAMYGQDTKESEEHLKLRVWSELREMKGPGFFGLLTRSGRKKLRTEGYRHQIDQSKAVDPALGGLIDHVLS